MTFNFREFLAAEREAVTLFLPMWLYLIGSMAVTVNAVTFFAGQMGDEYLAGETALPSYYHIFVGLIRAGSAILLTISI